MPKVFTGSLEGEPDAVSGASPDLTTLMQDPAFREQFMQGLEAQAQLNDPQAATRALENTPALGPAMSLLQGLTFQGGDELTGLATRLFPPEQLQNLTPEQQGQVGRNFVRDIQSQFREQNPKTALGLEITGSLPAAFALPISGLAQTRPLLTGTLLSGGFGTLSGALGAPEGQRTLGGGIGLGVGAPLGFGGTYLAQILTQKAAPFLATQAGRLFKTAKQTADDLIGPFVRSTFGSVDDAVSRLRQIGPEGTIADLGRPTQFLAGELSARSPSFGQRMANLIEKRASGMFRRLGQATRRALGSGGDDLAQTVDDIVRDRSAQVNPLYAKAFQQRASIKQLDDFVQVLDDQIAKSEGTSFARALTRFRRALFKTRPEGGRVVKQDIDALHLARKDLSDAASAAWRAGKTDLWRELRNMRQAFDETVMPPEYIQANRIFSEQSNLLDAVDLGERFFKMKTRDLAEWASGASDAEIRSALTGMASAIREKVGNVVGGGSVRRIFESPNAQARLKAMLGTDEAVQAYIQAAEREGIYGATANIAQSNSLTAFRERFQETFGSALRELPVDDISNRGLFNLILKKLRIETPTMSREVRQALEDRMLQQGLTPDVVENLMRAPGSEAVVEALRGSIAPATVPVTGVAGGEGGAIASDLLLR